MNVRAPDASEFMEMAQMGRQFWALTDFAHVEYRPDSVCKYLAIMAEQGLLLVAIENGLIVGFIGGLKTPLYANDSVVIGTELFWWVDIEHRQSGAALRLLRAIEAAARKAGCTHWSMMALESVEPDRAEAIYLRCGYERSERTYVKRL